MIPAADCLTIYTDGAQRLQHLEAPTNTPDITIDLPASVIENTLVVVMGDHDALVPYEMKRNQLLVKAPQGAVAVLGEHGWITGWLEHLDENDVRVRSPETGQVERVSQYRALQFLQRLQHQPVTLSYMLGGLGWQARHTLLLEPESSEVVLWKTMALVHNRTGTVFNVSRLRLMIGQPRGLDMAEEETAPHMERKMMKVSAARERVALASMPREEELEEAPSPNRMSIPEDFRGFDLESQRLPSSETTQFPVLTLSRPEMRARKWYYHTLDNGNTQVTFGYRLRFPPEILLPAGQVLVYSVDPKSLQLNSFLGTDSIGEQRGQVDSDASGTDVVLGASSLLTAETTMESETREAKASHEPVASRTLQYVTTRLVNHTQTGQTATVLLRYPLHGRVLMQTSCEPTRVTRGWLEFAVRVAPGQIKRFQCRLLLGG